MMTFTLAIPLHVRRLLICVLAFWHFSGPQAMAAMTLKDLYSVATTKNEDLGIATLTEEQVNESVRSLTASLSPAVDLNSRARFGNESLTTRSGLNRWDTSTSIGVTQNLFQGGSEFALWELKKIIPQIAKEETRNRYTTFYADLSAAFYTYLSNMEEKQKLEQQLEALEKRVGILGRRVKIGRDRQSDLLASRGQLARLRADLSALATTITRSITTLRNLTGLETLPELVDQTAAEKLNLPADADEKLQERPLQRSADLALERSKEEVQIEKSEYFPKVGLAGNYYLDQTRAGRDDYDVALELRWNLLDFGVTKANVAQKNIGQMIASKRSEQIKRLGEEALKNFRLTLQSKKQEYRNLNMALQATEASYQRQLRDAENGLVNQLDVIQSLDSVIALEKLTIRASNEIKILYHQGLAFLGILPTEAFAL